MKKIQVATLALALALPGFAFALDGKALYTQKNCHTCHGADGKAPIMPSYPKIAGQNADYMVAQMKDIQSGKRANGLSAAMKPLTTGITEAEFKAIADYLAKVK